MADVLWLTEQDVVALMDLKDAIGALEAALKLEAAGEALNMTKTLLQFGNNNLHAIGGKLGDVVGTKTWTHTAGGTSPIVLLWDANNGSLVAVIEAFALGNMRTGGISGVAADWMAAPHVPVMGLIGTGRQALSQVGAMLAVRDITRLQVFSPKAESRATFATKVRDEFGIEVAECDSAAAACRGAGIVTLVTRASTAFLNAEMLERGAHLNAVGAIAPDREEFTQDVFARTTRVAVDNLQGVQQLSREFMTRYDPAGWGSVRLISSLIAAGERRSAAEDLSLFKSMGMGISDLALATELVRRAQTQGLGRALPQPHKEKPRVSRRAP